MKDPRLARKKEEAARKAFLSNKSKQNRKYCNWLLADADAKLASRGKAGIPINKYMSKDMLPPANLKEIQDVGGVQVCTRREHEAFMLAMKQKNEALDLRQRNIDRNESQLILLKS